MKDLWLPNGFELNDGSQVCALLFSGVDWQIFDTNGAEVLLLARLELARKWSEIGLLSDFQLDEISFGDHKFQSLKSHKKYVLAPVEQAKSPDNKADAVAFAFAIKESRKLNADGSFHDAIYVERYARLLPTWTLTETVPDEVVLGTWLTGGVVISTDSFRRLRSLLGWMPEGSLLDIIAMAGFSVPNDLAVALGKSAKDQTTVDLAEDRINKDSRSEGVGENFNKVKSKVFCLPGRPKLEAFFNEHVIDIVFNAEKYQALGIDFPSAMVLHGPPGCGKTFAVERLIEFLDWPCYSIDSNSVGSPYIHATSRKIAEIFDKAIETSPSIIVIDEMESFLSERQSAGKESIYHIEEVAEFLRRIPEAIKNRVLIIAMTNIIDIIDPAILRRGRFDHIVEVSMPSKVEVASLFDSLLSKLPKAENLDLDVAVDALTGKALSDSTFVIREAARLAGKAGKTIIDQDSINAALKELPSDGTPIKRRIGFDKDS